MTGRLGIDFGTSNTVLALWDDTLRQGIPLHIPDYGQTHNQAGEEISVIPSLVHYTADNRIWIGQQVIQRNLSDSQRTFRWMKRYISHRSPIKVRLGDREITPYQAGQDFLNAVLVFAAQEIDYQAEEVALSVPVEAFEHYEDWLTSVAETAGMPRFRLIDEPSAAALGYGAHIQPGNVYLIFDVGGGTMHASVILIESEETTQSGRRCRVLGKAGRDIGGTSLDQWLYQKILADHRLQDSDPRVRQVSTTLLLQCQSIKEQLSTTDTADLVLELPQSNLCLSSHFTRSSFEDLLEEHNLYAEIQQVVQSALNQSMERGYRPEDIQAALMVGGSSQIPSIQRALRQIFGKERVMSNRPLDAVARGTAAFIAGVDFYDHIQHDYAIRFIDSQKGQVGYKVIVQRGTAYPSQEPVNRLVIKASHEGQQQLGLAIFEMSEQRQIDRSSSIELIFDPSGAARITQISPSEQEARQKFWMNENNPTFLLADPPSMKSEPRFEVEFNVDQNKRLIITARDLKNGQLTFSNYPVVKLT
jgi:molecular chaperone DnaK